MKTLILNVSGKDRPGIVDELAQLIKHHGGSWQVSQFAHMAGHFTGFVEVSLPENKEELFRQAIDALVSLQVQVLEGGAADHSWPLRATVSVTGNDKPGILAEVTGVLNGFDVNIEQLQSDCQSAPNWGGTLFKAKITFNARDDFDMDALVERLEAIADDFMVDVKSLSR